MTYYNSTSQLSFGDSRLSQSQSTVKQKRSSLPSDEFKSQTRRASVGGSQGSIALDPGCLPATIKMLHKFRNPETGIVKLHGAKDSGPVHLVGWAYRKDARLSPGESEFKFSDGTGVIVVRIDIPTDQEAWLLPRVRDLVNGPTRGHAKENDNKKVENESKNEDEKENDPEGETRNDEDDNSDHFRYLRLVGTVSQDVVDECLVLRAIHIREALPAESTFHHSIECAFYAIRMASDGTQNSGSSKAVYIKTTTTDISLDDVVLPIKGLGLRDPDKLRILKYLYHQRKEGAEVSIHQIKTNLHISDESWLKSSLEEMQQHDYIVYDDDLVQIVTE